jgi:hypothetical protein
LPLTSRALSLSPHGSLFGTRRFHSDMDDLSGSPAFAGADAGPAEESAGSDYAAYESVGEETPQPTQASEQPREEDDDPYGEREFLAAMEAARGPQAQPPDPYQVPPYQAQQPPYGGPAPANQLHAMLLNPETRLLVEQNLHQKYDIPYRMAQTAEQQRQIEKEYNAELKLLNAELRMAQAEQRNQELNRREMQTQQTLLPMMRRGLIDDLVKKHGLTPRQVAFDRVTGQPITDPILMRKQAEWLGSLATNERVTARKQSGVDRPYNAAGAAGAAKSVMQMTDKQFEQLERDAQRRGNRAFTGLG